MKRPRIEVRKVEYQVGDFLGQPLTCTHYYEVALTGGKNQKRNQNKKRK